MSKIKVHEYAKQIGRTAKELVVLLQEQGVNVKSHLSNIDEDGIKIINKELGISASDMKKVAEAKPMRAGFRFGQRPSNGRVVGTAASIRKEVEKEEKAKQRAARAEQKAKENAVVSKEVQEVKSVKVMLDNDKKMTNKTATKVTNAEKADEVVEAVKQQKNKKNESDKKSAQEEKKVGKIEGAIKSQGQNNNSQPSSQRKNQQGIRQQEKKQENTSKDNGVLKNNQGNNVKSNNENVQKNNNAQNKNQGNKNQGNKNQGNKNQGNKNQVNKNQGNNQKNNRGNKNQNKNQGNNQGNKNQGNKNQGNNQNNKNQGNRNNQSNNRYNNDKNGQGNRTNQSNNRYNNDKNGQGNRNNGDRTNQSNNRYNNDRNGQGNRNNGDRNSQSNNRYNNGDRNNQSNNRYNDRNGRGNNRGNDRNSSLSASTAFAATASKSSLEVGRSGRSNWLNRKNNNEDYEYEDSKENFEGLSKSTKKNKKKNEKPKSGAFIKPEPVVNEEPDDGIRTIILPEVLTIKELADKVKVQPSVLVKKLFLAGKVVTINQEITFEEAEEIALEYNCIAEEEEKIDLVAEILKEEEEDPALLQKRAPVVCVMGHVDHGKTSLLDAIRATNVTAKEAGGITQHIGAYVVKVDDEMITFLDTPGHEAFTSMRMRGANSTDIAILVVAADDGVMPQTVEAINHAKAAGIQVIVAINKIDKPSANIERVKQELVEHGLIAEDWGGDTVFVPVSAHTHEGIDQLLEMILLTAEMIELKANPNRLARGLVIEAELDKGRGPVATVLVQKGTLKVGNTVAVGSVHGKVRAMIDDHGVRVKEAGPSTPVEILGLNGVPNAGEILIATENEKEARNIAETFIKQGREKLLEDTKSKLSLDGLFSQIKAGNIKELNIIVKADVQGSVEAVKQSLLKLSNEEVAVRIIHGGVGAINESDVILASASNAIIIGFNVRPDNMAREISEREKVDLRLYKVIYNAIEDVAAAMKGMLDPVYEEKVIGHAEIRQIYKASGVGHIAGSYVLDGKILRGSKVRISREGKVIFDGNLASLKRFKDDVKEVAAGYDCGLLFEKFNDIEEFDQVEVYIMQEVPK